MRFPSVSLQIWKSYSSGRVSAPEGPPRSNSHQRDQEGSKLFQRDLLPYLRSWHGKGIPSRGMKDISSSFPENQHVYGFALHRSQNSACTFLPLCLPFRSSSYTIFILEPRCFLGQRSLPLHSSLLALQRTIPLNWNLLLVSCLLGGDRIIGKKEFSCCAANVARLFFETSKKRGFFVSFFFPHFLINEVAFKKGEVDISASQKSLKNIKDYN